MVHMINDPFHTFCISITFAKNKIDNILRGVDAIEKKMLRGKVKSEYYQLY